LIFRRTLVIYTTLQVQINDVVDAS
jgi:hypothetical protein